MLGTLADIISMISFALTIILLIRSEKLRNEIVLQKITYQNQQNEMLKHLEIFRVSLINNEALSLMTISDIRKELQTYCINLNHMLSSHDRKIINQTIQYLDEDFSQELQKKLLKNIDYLMARFTKQEV